MSELSKFVRTLSGSGWAPVSRACMDDQNLNIQARGVLAWLVTRPDGHEINVNYIQRRCGLSQPRWQRVRKELEAAGYLTVERKRHSVPQTGAGEGKKKKVGAFYWEYHLTDIPSIKKCPVFIS